MKKPLRRQIKRIKHVANRIRLFKNWPVTVWPFNRPGPRVLEMRNGLKVFVRDVRGSDFWILYEVWARNDYLSLPRKGIILDIGSHIGTFALYAAAKTNALIYAFEPDPDNYEIIQMNVRLNGLHARIVPIRAAVTDTDEMVTLYHYAENTGGHGLTTPNEADKRRPNVTTSQVPGIRLETFLDGQGIKHVDFIKMDVEGAEYRIFLQRPELLKMIGQMEVETHRPTSGERPEDLVRFLQECGFSVTYSSVNPERLIHVTR